MSRPSSRMRPAVGRSTPVSRLITVVLPAPFGPISACRAPFCTESVTSLVAMMPPNCFTSPCVCSTAAISALCRLAGKPRGQPALYGGRAFGDPRCEGEDLRPRQPEHRQHDDGEDDALHEREFRP